jgi:hypothetical protein
LEVVATQASQNNEKLIGIGQAKHGGCMPELRGALAALFKSDAPEILVEGRAGTSKTTGILCKLIDDCERYPGCRVLIVRETRVSLTESVLVTFDRLVQPGHEAYSDTQRANRRANNFRNGSTIVWGGLDSPEGLFSTEWDRIYVAEATETKLEAWDLFGRAMRNNRTPYHQRIADCNPGPPSHWLNQRATPAADAMRDSWKTRQAYDRLQQFNHWQDQNGRSMRRLISVHPDNPGYWDKDAWDWTPFGREYVNTTLASMTGHRRARMFDGRWKAAEGTVYPEFDEAKHVIDPFPIPREWPCTLTEDPGFDHPTAIVNGAIAPNGRLYICAEIVRREATIEQDALEIKRSILPNFNVVKMLGDPHYMFSRTKHSSGETIADQMRKHGLHFVPAPAAANQTQIAAQVEMVRTGLTTLGSDGRPMIVVFRSCPRVISGFQTWGYERDGKGQLKGGEDRFEDIGDDEMDCVRMIVASRPRHEAHRVRVLTDGGE